MQPTVLVVEDDFDTLHPLSELLKLKGYSVITATDASRGLGIARERHPDLIISDIALPGQSGLGLISEVRADQSISATPIVVISGCGPAVLVEAESAGADFCLQKPLDMDLFWLTIGQVTENLGFPRLGFAAGLDLEGQSQTAVEIDSLVEDLRRSSSKDERELYIQRLKQRILQD
jgi:DNA-binding response OmpR family regulator